MPSVFYVAVGVQAFVQAAGNRYRATTKVTQRYRISEEFHMSDTFVDRGLSCTGLTREKISVEVQGWGSGSGNSPEQAS